MFSQLKGNKDEIYLFSINTVAYLRANGIEPLRFEKTKDTNKIVYWFENDNVVQFLLGNYKKDVFLNKFIENLKITREEIIKNLYNS